MRLRALKETVDMVLDKYGDMNVVIILTRTESCSECGQSVDRNCESDKLQAYALGDGKGGYNFWIDGEKV